MQPACLLRYITKTDYFIWIFGLVRRISYCTYQLVGMFHATYPWHNTPHYPVCYVMNALHLVAQPADGHAMLYYGQYLI